MFLFGELILYRVNDFICAPTSSSFGWAGKFTPLALSQWLHLFPLTALISPIIWRLSRSCKLCTVYFARIVEYGLLKKVNYHSHRVRSSQLYLVTFNLLRLVLILWFCGNIFIIWSNLNFFFQLFLGKHWDLPCFNFKS